MSLLENSPSERGLNMEDLKLARSPSLGRAGYARKVLPLTVRFRLMMRREIGPSD